MSFGEAPTATATQHIRIGEAWPSGTAAVVGTGMIGLTTAIAAQEAGYRVTIYSDTPFQETTSAKAPASFRPSNVPYDAVVAELTQLSWSDFERLAARDGGQIGVRSQIHWEASSATTPPPPYLDLMQDVDEVIGSVPGGYASAWRYRTFFIDTSVFLPYLYQHFRLQGGFKTSLLARFESLDDLAALPHDVVFNCTGLGARELCGDRNLVPLKGQIIIAEPAPELHFSLSADGFYIYPRKRDTVLGGTVERNVDNEIVDIGVVHEIVRTNARVWRRLTVQRVMYAYAGRRPYRTNGVRIELEARSDKPIVHNYGHGGSGFTLCWGSARRAVGLV